MPRLELPVLHRTLCPLGGASLPTQISWTNNSVRSIYHWGGHQVVVELPMSLLLAIYTTSILAPTKVLPGPPYKYS
jgi:hypothetical protein